MKTKIELLIVLLSIICISNNSLNSFASTNLALNKPAFANDSAMDWAGPPRYANDGNLSTRWQSTKNLGTQIAPGRFAQNSWWMVDLQNTYNIEGVIIQWEAAAAIDYKIMVSTDNQQWNEVVSITNENGGTDRIRFSPVPTRYVKIVTTVGNMQYSPSMWEFEVYAENDFPLLTYYKQDFNKGITAEFSFWDDENNNASISIDTVAANNLCLNINNILPAQFSLVLNFDSIEKRNLSAFPFISFHYKADTTIAFKIAVINDSDTIYEESYRQIFAFNEWIEFMDSIRINPLSLLRIKALFLMFKTNKNNQIISIDNLAFGSLAEPYSFKILKPSRGSMLKPNESVKLITNAPEGSRVVIQLNNQNYAELSSAPYVIELNNLSEGFYHVKAIVYQGSIEVMHSESSFIVSGDNGFTYRNEATEYLFNSLKALTRSDFSMFGVANGLTINYKYGPRHAFNDKSDCKDITGSHPAFIESDFMWYDGDKNFMRNDTIAMREAYKRGMITGYCWHLRGLHSGSFYAYENNVLTADKNLVKEIISNPNRSTNPALNWYLSKIDQLLIPVFKGLGFPIIFRPFHEMTGNWFWWGTSTCTADEYIALYRLTVNYLKANGVNNVLYAWAPDKSADMSRYPGDGYVDVIGYDGYEIGTASYHSITTFTSNYGKLASYALAHNKIAAITETGYGNYPGAHYDYWYDHVLIPMKKHSKARHAAWIMTWYNADWNNNNTGTSWIPYKGIESKSNGQDAIDNFMKFYDDPRTIFANDIPTLYLNDDNSAFVYPSQISINVGDSLTLIGGTKANWFNEKVSWNSDNPSVATIDSSGKVRAINPGTATITLICPNGNTATCSVMVRSGNRIVNSASNPFKIYPNPITHKLFHVEAGNGYSGKYKIAIYDLFGHCVYQVLQTEKVATIQCNDIKPGVYNVFIETKNQINVFKIVIL